MEETSPPSFHARPPHCGCTGMQPSTQHSAVSPVGISQRVSCDLCSHVVQRYNNCVLPYTIFIDMKKYICYKTYPLVNVYITNWKITMLLMGKSTISMTIFKFAKCLFTRPGILQLAQPRFLQSHGRPYHPHHSRWTSARSPPRHLGMT